MAFIEAEFDGWPTERRVYERNGGCVRLLDTVRVEGGRIILGVYAIHYDAHGREIAREEPLDNVVLYLH
jgi:hypothetical protein